MRHPSFDTVLKKKFKTLHVNKSYLYKSSVVTVTRKLPGNTTTVVARMPNGKTKLLNSDDLLEIPRKKA